MTASSVSIAVSAVRGSGSLVVAVFNNSRGKLRLWQNNNSWGWWNWRVVVIRNRIVFLVERNLAQEFTKNIPSYVELAARQKKGELLNMDDGDWICNGQKGFAFQKGDEIFVVYSVPETPESRANRVWTGTSTAYYKHS